jgi:hypothetical protein
MGETYKIIRKFSMGDKDEIQATGLTLEEAQDHCSREDTSGPGWMDVYYKED